MDLQEVAIRVGKDQTVCTVLRRFDRLGRVGASLEVVTQTAGPILSLVSDLLVVP